MKTMKPNEIKQDQDENKQNQEEIKRYNEVPTIALCVPLYGSVDPDWVINWFRFVMDAMARYKVHVLMQQSQPVSVCRNELVKMAIQKGADYIFWLDSDMVMPQGALDKMFQVMEQTQAHLVSGMYFAKDDPHYPVIRYWKSKGFFKFENPPLGEIFDIDGCGFGCCLTDINLFKEIPPPWFVFSHEMWGYKDICLSEDLYFCRNLLRNNKKLVCDSSIVPLHLGSKVGHESYLIHSDFRQKTRDEREEALQDLTEFLELDYTEIDLRVMSAPQFQFDDWTKYITSEPSTETIRKYYENAEGELYGGIYKHFGETRKFDNEFLNNMLKIKKQQEKVYPEKPRVLDVGCGIGQYSLMLARNGFDVTIADLGGKHLSFAEYRLKKHGLPFRKWDMSEEDEPPLEQYDIIVAIDVFEHVHPDEFADLIHKLMTVKYEQTEMVYTTAFGMTAQNFQHFNKEDKHERLIKKLANHKKND